MPVAAFIWLAIGVIAAVIEGITTQLVSLWFVAGALSAVVVVLLDGGFSLQLLMFALVSALLLICIRPLAKKKMTVQKQPTNADQMIGKTAVITVATDEAQNRARAMVEGLEWSVRAESNYLLVVGDRVEVLAIEGVTLVVRPCSVS